MNNADYTRIKTPIGVYTVRDQHGRQSTMDGGMYAIFLAGCSALKKSVYDENYGGFVDQLDNAPRIV